LPVNYICIVNIDFELDLDFKSMDLDSEWMDLGLDFSWLDSELDWVITMIRSCISGM